VTGAKTKPFLSVVVPVYQAEDCVQELCRRIHLAVSALAENYELLLVDDGSRDGSWEKICRESQANARVRGLRLARNFGQHQAITAGLDLAGGEWVVVMDCDLQDPPELIGNLLAKAREGYDVVVAEFGERTEGWLRQRTSEFFWRTLSWLAGTRFDPKVGNFRIFSRIVTENFRLYREQLRLLGGIVSLMGFRVASIPVQREARFAGKTSYDLRKLIGVAAEICVAYSDKPLKLSIFVGVALSAISIVVAATVLVLALRGVIQVPGWASVIVSLYFLGGLIIANLGILGLYLGKTYDETKRRPIYIIAERTGG
jgi:glycosyltransferase involved in cell wall biosynthesis